jgi:hypothetical protein
MLISAVVLDGLFVFPFKVLGVVGWGKAYLCSRSITYGTLCTKLVAGSHPLGQHIMLLFL